MDKVTRREAKRKIYDEIPSHGKSERIDYEVRAGERGGVELEG